MPPKTSDGGNLFRGRCTYRLSRTRTHARWGGHAHAQWYAHRNWQLRMWVTGPSSVRKQSRKPALQSDRFRTLKRKHRKLPTNLCRSPNTQFCVYSKIIIIIKTFTFANTSTAASVFCRLERHSEVATGAGEDFGLRRKKKNRRPTSYYTMSSHAHWRQQGALFYKYSSSESLSDRRGRDDSAFY